MKFKKYITEYETKATAGDFDSRDVETEAIKNNFFRHVLFTGKNTQLVLMSLQPHEDIGNEVHPDVDQFFRIEEGEGKAVLNDKDEVPLKAGSSVLVVAGTWHNIINLSDIKPMKLYTLYSPPNHPDGTIHKTKKDAVIEEKPGQ